MPAKPPSWPICVVTASDYSNLKNALLYSDHVHWISLETFVAVMTSLVELILPTQARTPGSLLWPLPTTSMTRTRWTVKVKRDNEPECDSHLELPQELSEICNEIEACGLTQSVTQHFGVDALLHRFGPIFEYLARAIQGSVPHGPQVVLPEEESLANRFAAVVKQSRVVALPSHAWGGRHPGRWDVYVGAQALFNAVSRLLLPEVSALPIPAISELRDKLWHVLDPMRAEILRFTDELRKVVGDEPEQSRLEAEAENLIAVRVEPIVREAAARTRELIDQKWRRLYTGAAKAFGITGAACVDPRLLAKAVQQTLNVAALTFADPDEKPGPPKATAEFVLVARSMIKSTRQ